MGWCCYCHPYASVRQGGARQYWVSLAVCDTRYWVSLAVCESLVDRPSESVRFPTSLPERARGLLLA